MAIDAKLRELEPSTVAVIYVAPNVRDNIVQLYIYGKKNTYTATKNICTATKDIYTAAKNIYTATTNIYMATKIYIQQRKYIYIYIYIYTETIVPAYIHCQQSLPHWKWADNSAVNSRIYNRVGSKL